ncbi:MAG: bifunctional folylpolyglutamate synthase/dihydrofolate synthase, partial [Deltaproteobacteria bacterium]|nr:bifunctional folylpolyglutamate synthase/dihydrofolate synthase [Deltaproteobacteria bacterium]
MRALLDALGAPDRRMGTVIHVGGTNGKGSTVAILGELARAAGARVARYTSPHLSTLRERIELPEGMIEEEAFAAAADAVAAAGGDDFTFFEQVTAIACVAIAAAAPDVTVLEVGLGGRLDAVNIIDADAAIVTTVDLDHEEWLGRDRDSIGREKAGIFRARRPAVVGDAAAPAAVPEHARAIGAQLVLAGRDYDWQVLEPGRWRWRSGDTVLDLPMPALAAPVQLANAAAAIAALHALR